ncbi:MAG: hypothetical protein ACLR78_06185 [Roseburia sp.]
MSEKTFAELLERHIRVKMVIRSNSGRSKGSLVVNGTTPDGYKVNENREME